MFELDSAGTTLYKVRAINTCVYKPPGATYQTGWDVHEDFRELLRVDCFEVRAHLKGEILHRSHPSCVHPRWRCQISIGYQSRHTRELTVAGQAVPGSETACHQEYRTALLEVWSCIPKHTLVQVNNHKVSISVVCCRNKNAQDFDLAGVQMIQHR